MYSQPKRVANEKPTMIKLVPVMNANLGRGLGQRPTVRYDITHNPTKSNLVANSRHEASELLSKLTVRRDATNTMDATKQIGRFM